MKKTVCMVLLVLLWTVSTAAAAELKVGDKVAPFSLQDGAGKSYTLDVPPYAGKVVVVHYTDKASSDKNKELETKLKAAKLDTKTCEKMAIANLKDTWLPDAVLKKFIKAKQEEIKAPILLDDNYSIINAWGLHKKAYNIVLIDKSRVVRYLYKGGERAAVPAAEVDKLISLIKEYQVK